MDGTYPRRKFGPLPEYTITTTRRYRVIHYVEITPSQKEKKDLKRKENELAAPREGGSLQGSRLPGN